MAPGGPDSLSPLQKFQIKESPYFPIFLKIKRNKGILHSIKQSDAGCQAKTMSGSKFDTNLPAASLRCLVQRMDHKAAAQLRLKPSGFGRHDVAAVGDIDNLLHGYGVERQGHFHFAAVYA